MPDKYPLFFLLALLSEIIGTVSGFGSSILFVPLASMFFDLKSVLGITAIFHVFSNLSKLALFREGIDKSIALKLGIPAVVFVILGAWLSSFVPTRSLELVMNGILIFLSLFLLIRFRSKVEQNSRNLYLGGISSGFLAGLIGTGGALRGIVLSAFQLPKQIFIATSALIDLGVDSSRAVVYLLQGYFKKDYLILIPFLIGISMLGTYLGKVILKHTSENLFRYLVLSVIILSAIYQLITFLLEDKV